MTVPGTPPARQESFDPSDLTYAIANDAASRTRAYRLVYRNYLAKRLIASNENELRVTPFHMLDSTVTFVATHGSEVICTVSLIGDGEMGLPMECVYPDEVAALRRRGLFIGEVSCLATVEMGFSRFLPIFVRLTSLMAQHARAYGMDQFLIATHPRHARFYKRYMGFQQIGPLCDYPNVRNAPAVACALDFERIDHERPPCYDDIFGERIPAAKLRPKRMTDAERDRFSRAADRSGICVPMFAG